MTIVNYIPEEKQVGSGVELSAYHATNVIKAFQSALDSNQCLTKLPISLATEAALRVDELKDIKESLTGEEDPDRAVVVVPPDKVENPDGYSPTVWGEGDLADDIWRNAQECFTCPFPEDLPSLDDIMGIFDGLIGDAEELIAELKGLLSSTIDFPDFPDFIQLMSNMCIPNLNALLAILIADLLSRITDISLMGFLQFAFSFGIIGQLIDAVFAFLKNMIAYAANPVECILSAVRAVIEAIPSEQQLAMHLSKEEKEKLADLSGYDLTTVNTNQDNGTVAKAVNPVIASILREREQFNKDFVTYMKDVKKSYSDADKTINDALQNIDVRFQELIGIVDYVSCERARTGIPKYSVQIQAIKKLIGFINLIRAVLEKKIEKSPDVQDVRPSAAGQPAVSSQTDAAFSPGDVADIMEKVTGKVTELVEQPDGKVGFLITDKSKDSDFNRLSMLTCSTEDFLKGSHPTKIAEGIRSGIKDGDARSTINVADITDGSALYVPQMTELVNSVIALRKPSVKPINKAAVLQCSPVDEIMNRFKLI